MQAKSANLLTLLDPYSLLKAENMTFFDRHGSLLQEDNPILAQARKWFHDPACHVALRL